MADNRRKGKPRKTATQKRREARTAIIRRWDQLMDDLFHLEQDIRNAPVNTFTNEERDDAIFELGETCWNALVNYRPRLPASVYDPLRADLGNRRRRRSTLAVVRGLSEEEFAKMFPGEERAELLKLLGGAK